MNESINPIKKQTEEPERHFSKEDTETVNRVMQGCLLTLIFREMRYHLTLVQNG